MKRILRWICPALFLGICAAVIWFLHLFVVEKENMQYINWHTATKIESDGTETPIDVEEIANFTDASGTFRFEGTIPDGLPSGYLLFETSGAKLTLWLNGTQIYQSAAVAAEGARSMSQATIPLPTGEGGELTLTCRILDGSFVLFPPLLRFMPDDLRFTQDYAMANRTALPTGAAALAFVLICGIFLLRIVSHHPDFRLIPLLLAAAGLTIYRITQGEGFYFLSAAATGILGHSWVGIFTILALAVYLFINRSRDFWRYFAIAAAWSGGALLFCYLISLARDSHLAFYINTALSGLFRNGAYDGLLYWATWWLTIVCGLISAYSIAQAFTRQQIESNSIALRNELLMNSYRSLEQRMRRGAVHRHEFHHQLTALRSLCQKGDIEGMKALLDDLTRANTAQSPTRFTDHFAINAILQDADLRADQAGIRFQAQVHVPEDLPMPEQDLCSLLMNMLDNALEACAKVSRAQERWIRIRIKFHRGILAIRCENSYEGILPANEDGTLRSTKADPGSHGLGLSLMSAIAEKYGGMINTTHTDDGSFVLQTALHL